MSMPNEIDVSVIEEILIHPGNRGLLLSDFERRNMDKPVCPKCGQHYLIAMGWRWQCDNRYCGRYGRKYVRDPRGYQYFPSTPSRSADADRIAREREAGRPFKLDREAYNLAR